MDELSSAELVKQMNKELYWTGWYAVSGDTITYTEWAPAPDTKKEQIEQAKRKSRNGR